MFGALLAAPVIVSCGWGERVPHVASYEEFDRMFSKKDLSPEDVALLFPKNEQEAKDFITWAKRHVTEHMKQFLSIQAEKRTFDNTVKAFDNIRKQFGQVYGSLYLLTEVLAKSTYKEACHTGCEELQAFGIEAFDQKAVYDAFDAYAQRGMKIETLSPSKLYMINEMIKGFKRQGLALPEEQLAQVRELNKEIATLGLTFQKNVSEDASAIFVTREALAGLDDHFITNLKRNEQDLYKLGCDYPTYFEVMKYCTSDQTRKDLYRAFLNRAYPINVPILKSFIAKNAHVAQLLNFPSYAALELDGEIAKTPERVESFLNDLIAKAQPRMAPFVQQLKEEMPQGMSLTDDGKFKPWDMKYLTTAYKKRHFNFDEHAAAEYFPVEHTLQRIFDIFQNFLGIVFTQIKPAWAWHKDVQLLQVTDKQSGTLLGYLYLDLYPRQDKNGHAFLLDIVTSSKETDINGATHRTPAVGFLLANFPKASADRPALLKHEDVVTLCHELGHAMHFFIGSAELKTFSGFNVKYDFVETPSQLFELWPYDKECLKAITHHYKTGQPMPDAMIDTIIGMNQFENKTTLLGQCFYASFSLKLYQNIIKNGDIEALEKELETRIIPHTMYDDKTHLYASFGHLVGYCSRYYCYLWSKVYSLALLDELKKDGLTTVDGGKRLADIVLGVGGSADSEKQLELFLGHKPSIDPFLRDMGIAQEKESL